MSPTQELLAVALGLYLLECGMVVPRGALLFAARGVAGLRIVRGDHLIGSPTHGVYLPWPLPPLGLVFVTDPWPVAISTDGICPLPGGQFGGPPPPDELPPALAFGEIRAVEARGTQLRVNGRAYGTCASGRSALQLARLMQSLMARGAGERAAVLADAHRQRCDARAVATAAAQLRAGTRVLRLACNTLLLYLFAVSPLVVWLCGLPGSWLPLLIGLLPLWAWPVAAFARARRVLPGGPGRRLLTVQLALLPMAAIRAVDRLTREALAAFHPAAVARVLCPADGYREFLRGLLGDVLYSPPGGTDLAGRIRNEYRADLRAALESLACGAGVDLAALLVAPPPDEARCQRWCPRCRTQFVVAATECATCPGVALREFPGVPAAERTA